MAEFTEVIKQAVRMCHAQSECGICPLLDAIRGVDDCPFRSCVKATEPKIAEWERIVCDWAQEHPEPVYPCWGDAWQTPFPDNGTTRLPCPKWFMSGERRESYCKGDCFECANRPIPADIAEKLGIEPIGVGE